MKWINVKDQPVPIDREILICTVKLEILAVITELKNGEIEYETLLPDRCHSLEVKNWDMAKVTHWMLIPDLPNLIKNNHD